MTVYNPQSSSIMVWDACTHLSWHRGCLLCRCKGTGATQGRRRASGTAKWRERRWWPEEKATFHRCPSSPWTQCGILTGECGFCHYCFNIENIEQPIHCDQELLNCQEFIQLFIDTWHYHDSEEFNLTKNEILDPSISEYLGGKGISNQAGSTAPSRSHIGVIFYCLFENTSYLMPKKKKRNFLLDADDLTHHFPQSHKHGAGKGQKASEFLRRTFTQVHEMHAQAKTCQEDEEKRGVRKLGRKKNIPQDDCPQRRTSIIAEE